LEYPTSLTAENQLYRPTTDIRQPTTDQCSKKSSLQIEVRSPAALSGLAGNWG
jgi:hypothetical protein